MIYYLGLIICVIISLLFNEKWQHRSFVSKIRIPNKVVIVTGADRGIGYETAKELSRRAGRVILACKDIEKAQRAATKIQSETGYDVVVKYLDLASFKTIIAFAKDIIKTEGRVDILINNAETVVPDNSLTEDHLPIDAQINYFGPFLLTILLLPVMKKLSKTARIINVTSVWYMFGTTKNLDKQGKTILERSRVYFNTKLANILFTQQLAEEVDARSDNIIVNCCHPGAFYIDMFWNLPRILKWVLYLLFLTPKQEAQTLVYLATQQKTPGLHTSGRYYRNCKEDIPLYIARNRFAAFMLWKLSLDVCFTMRRWE